MLESSVLVIGCDEVACWPQVLGLEHRALRTLVTPGAVVPPAPDAPWREQVARLVDAARIAHVVFVGHTDCRVLRSVFVDETPGAAETARTLALAGLSREALLARYAGCDAQGLLEAAVQESLLAQPELLLTTPALRRRADSGTLHVELWVLDATTQRVMVFDPQAGQFEPAGAAGRARPAGAVLPCPHVDDIVLPNW